MSLIVARPTNLADPRLGAKVVHATDDFFADKSRLIDPAEPVFIPGKYDAHGKWMDGWESRRKRVPGHDAAIVKLARPGVIEAVLIDTRHFTGNYPPAASIEACVSDMTRPPKSTAWTALTPTVPIAGDAQRHVEINDAGVYTHVRLNIFPDGGVARLRVYGRIEAPLLPAEGRATFDLLAAANGGRALVCNDEHFGALANMILPGRAADMGEGWETRRRREPGNDWAILKLARPGVIEEIVVDTAHFKGNYPDRCSLSAAAEAPDDPFALAQASEAWAAVLPTQKLEADREHVFASEIAPHAPVRFVRLDIMPDGGVSRLRLYGRPAQVA
jgi:allantoicase